MGDFKQFEPLRIGGRWTFDFKLPQGLEWDGEVHKAEELQLAEDTNSSFPTKMPEGEINMELIDRTDDINEVKSVRAVMDEWIRLIEEGAHERLEGIYKYFEPDYDNTDPTNMTFYLRKPVDQLTEEEKQEIKDLICECFGIKNLENFLA